MVVRATTQTTATAPFNILDVYTGASVAYSLRKLRSGYSGAAIRIRRSTDNAEVDVPFGGVPIAGTSNLEDFLKSFTGGFGKNRLIYSDDLSNAEWVKVGATTIGSNVDTAPDGSMTADKMIEGTANERPRIRPPGASVENGKTYVFSFYAKPAGRKYLEITIFNFTTSTFVDIDAAVRVSGSTNVRLTKLPGGSGWTRVEVWGTFTQPTGGYRSDLYMSDTASNTAYTGDGTSGIIFSSFQVEEGNAATTYDYRFNSTTSTTSAFITTWYDQSGNARNATQANAALQPRIVNSGVIEKENNVPIVRLLGANRMSTASPVFSTGAASYYVHLIAKSENTSIGCFFSSGSPSTNAFIGAFQTAPNIERHAWWGNDVDATSDLTVFKLRTYAYDGTTRYTYINKVTGVAQIISGKNTASNNLFIGSDVSGTSIYQGAISELIIYNSDLNPQRIAIQDNAMSYYGIT